MKNNKTFSIVVPVYNAVKYLERCIESLERQNYDKSLYEIICVNDGSKDDSLKLLEHLNSQYPNIVVIDQPNAGASAARNHGLRRARNEYVWFVDSDDTVTEDALVVLNQELEQGIDFLLFNHNLVSASDELMRRDMFHYHIGSYSSGSDVFMKGFIPSLPWNRVFRRNFLATNELQFAWEYPDDEEFLFRTYVLAEKAKVINKSLYNYRYLPVSYSRGSQAYKRYVDGGDLGIENSGYYAMMEHYIPFSQKYLKKNYWCKVTLSNTRNLFLNLYRYLKSVDDVERKSLIKDYMNRLSVVLHKLYPLYNDGGWRAKIMKLVMNHPGFCYKIFTIVAKIKHA